MNLDRTPLTGIIAERYEIRREAGRGGMAIVFLAWDLRHDRPVALKVLRPEIGLLLGADRFLREIEIAAHLAHPHILGVLDSGVAETEGGVQLPYYVMPFLEGQSLAEHLTAHRQLPLDDALRIAAEVADALQYAHGLGVVHRDIKPANILLQQDHALVADFGIARMLAEQTNSGATTGTVIGTPHYMSPEQFAATQPVDGRSDIYSLGCVLYEMLTGEPPFTGKTPQAISAQHQVDHPRDLGSSRPDLPPGIAQAVGRALAKAPGDRYNTAGEFRDALNRLRGLTSGSAGQARRASTRWRLGIALGAILVALGVWRWRPRGYAEIALPTRILVAYFDDLTGGSLRATADALTESLTDHLQAVPDLAVTASTMVAPFRGAPVDTLRARFQVDRLVTGTVARSGDSTLVVIRVVDPSNGRQLGARPMTVASPIVVAALVEDLSAFVRQTLWKEREEVARRRQVGDPQAWALVQQAMALNEEAEDAVVFRADREGFKALDRADSLLRAAGLREPRSALIPLESARTADRRAFLAEFIRQDLPRVPADVPDPAVARAAALATVSQVIRDHPRSAEAHEFRGRLFLGLHRLVGADSLLLAATRDLELAKELDPTRSGSWSELSRAYRLAGRYRESMLAISQAEKADVFLVNRGEVLRGRFESGLLLANFSTADSACHAGLRESPGDQRFSDCEVELWGRSKSDRASAARALAITDSLAAIERGALLTAARTLWVGGILARAGLGDSADRLASRAMAAVPPGAMPSILLVEAANLRLLRADPDSALTLMAAAVRMNRAEVPYLNTAPWFNEIRQDPRFAAAVRGISPREAAVRP